MYNNKKSLKEKKNDILETKETNAIFELLKIFSKGKNSLYFFLKKFKNRICLHFSIVEHLTERRTSRQ
jgi:hypothetical protein